MTCADRNNGRMTEETINPMTTPITIKAMIYIFRGKKENRKNQVNPVNPVKILTLSLGDFSQYLLEEGYLFGHEFGNGQIIGAAFHTFTTTGASFQRGFEILKALFTTKH